jgi:2-oxoadipate dioxygenase/decarboxylase
MTIDEFLNKLWQGYTQIAPSALKIRQLLEGRGEDWVNDHIAFRTYDKGPIALADLEPHLLGFGYQRFEPYQFEDKKLRAYGYLHPEEGYPRVFLSELETHKLSDAANKLIDALVAQVDADRIKDPSCMFAGPLWEIPTEDTYRALLEESEYAGWVAVNGLCANHFTVSVNGLKEIPDLDALMTILEEAGFKMNMAGGRIKGTPEVKLVQGSTIADKTMVTPPAGTAYEVTTCYTEFAQRFDGFNGFVPKSADKIFESTNVK